MEAIANRLEAMSSNKKLLRGWRKLHGTVAQPKPGILGQGKPLCTLRKEQPNATTKP